MSNVTLFEIFVFCPHLYKSFGLVFTLSIVHVPDCQSPCWCWDTAESSIINYSGEWGEKWPQRSIFYFSAIVKYKHQGHNLERGLKPNWKCTMGTLELNSRHACMLCCKLCVCRKMTKTRLCLWQISSIIIAKQRQMVINIAFRHYL